MSAFITPLSILPTSASRPLLSPQRLSPQRTALRKTRSFQTTRRQTIRATTSPSAPPQPSALVDEILKHIDSTDFGATISQKTRVKLDRNIRTLSAIGRYRPNPMSDPSIFSNYTVAYTSASSQQNRAAAGGRFRSSIARVLLPTRGLFQHVISPNIVVNVVCFRLLGFLNGCVSLKGTLHSLEPDTGKIEVKFEPPRLRVANAVFEYGPRSRVQLTTTYLDERVRIGVGGRGSLFVFSRGGAADSAMAQEWKQLFDAEPLSSVLVPLIAVLAVVAIWKSTWFIRAAMLLLLIVCLLYLRRSTGSDDSGAVESIGNQALDAAKVT